MFSNLVDNFNIKNLSKRTLIILGVSGVSLILLVTFLAGEGGSKKASDTNNTPAFVPVNIPNSNNTQPTSTDTNTSGNNQATTTASKTDREIAQDEYDKKRTLDLVAQKKRDDEKARKAAELQKQDEDKIKALQAEYKKAQENLANAEAAAQ